MEKRHVIMTITKVAYKQQSFDIEVPKEIKDDEIYDYLVENAGEYEVDDTIEWERTFDYKEDDIPGVDSDRYDVYRGGKQVMGGHL